MCLPFFYYAIPLEVVTVKNGYTQLPNSLLEALTKIRISGEEWQCLCLILRKTYGWHKQEDWISNSLFVKATGIKKQNVNRALKKLIKKNIVIKKDYMGKPIYSLLENNNTWVALPKKTLDVIINDYWSNQRASNSVIQNDTDKRNNIKERNTKERNNTKDKSFLIKPILKDVMTKIENNAKD